MKLKQFFALIFNNFKEEIPYAQSENPNIDQLVDFIICQSQLENSKCIL